MAAKTHPGDDIPPMAGKLGVLGANGPYDAGRYAAGPGGEEDDPMGEECAEAWPGTGAFVRSRCRASALLAKIAYYARGSQLRLYIEWMHANVKE